MVENIDKVADNLEDLNHIESKNGGLGDSSTGTKALCVFPLISGPPPSLHSLPE